MLAAQLVQSEKWLYIEIEQRIAVLRDKIDRNEKDGASRTFSQRVEVIAGMQAANNSEAVNNSKNIAGKLRRWRCKAKVPRQRDSLSLFRPSGELQGADHSAILPSSRQSCDGAATGS